MNAEGDQTAGGAPLLSVHSVCKRYGATVAVAGLDLKIESGSVHALVGENGAGKSTLGKIITGVVIPDEGEIRVAGHPASLRSPRDAIDLGITCVAQELALVPSATALANVFLGVEDRTGPFVRAHRLAARFRELTERTGIEVPSGVPVGALPVAEQQKVEILRALVRKSRLIVMDEPTARLSAVESAKLMAVVRELALSGVAVVFISHNLDEVIEHADTITVMRDGHLVRTRAAAEETHESLIEAMIGRSLDATFPPKRIPRPRPGQERLRVRALTRAGSFDDVSFSVDAGEIVVMAGLVGAGRSEVARAIFGVDRIDSGQVLLDGDDITTLSVADRIRHGMAMIPESRKDQGLVLMRSLCENVSLPSVRRFVRGGFVLTGRERREVRNQSFRMSLRAASLSLPVSLLSGGNQQKVLFARWLLDQPRCLIADEPTRGVDIGAKQAIYEHLVGLAESGMGLLVISSQLEEVIGLAHRVLIMREGRIVQELRGPQIEEDCIMQAAFGVVAA